MPNSNWVTDNCQPVIIPKAHRAPNNLVPRCWQPDWLLGQVFGIWGAAGRSS